jgi:hypothetical protein
MPAVALVGAAFSVSAGIGALGAAATLGATLAAGASIAGGVLVGLGTLTKNPKLTKIGAVLGIAGGLGTAASKASAASAAKSAAAEAAGDLAFAKADAAQLAGQGLGESAITQNLGTYGADTASALGQQQGFSINSVLGQQSTSTAAGPQMSLDPSQATRATALAPEMSRAATQVSQPLSGGAIAQEAGLGVKNAVSGQGTGTFGKVMDFMRDKQNAEILKLGGGLVQGAMTSYDQQSLMKEKLRQDEAARGRYNQSILGQRMYNY